MGEIEPKDPWMQGVQRELYSLEKRFRDESHVLAELRIGNPTFEEQEAVFDRLEIPEELRKYRKTKEWEDYANCDGVDRNLFVPRSEEAEQLAKAVCSGCLVVGECLEDALTRPVEVGIRGRMTGAERQRVLNYSMLG